jgi:hypothetical protein
MNDKIEATFPEPMRIYLAYPTTDDRWLVGFGLGGRVTLMPEFLGSYDDAMAIVNVFNERERQRYSDESAKLQNDKLKAAFPTLSLSEVAKKLGIKVI